MVRGASCLLNFKNKFFKKQNFSFFKSCTMTKIDWFHFSFTIKIKKQNDIYFVDFNNLFCSHSRLDRLYKQITKPHHLLQSLSFTTQSLSPTPTHGSSKNCESSPILSKCLINLHDFKILIVSDRL